MPDQVIEFTKLHGAGNDFIAVDNRTGVFQDEHLAMLARQLCRRRFSVGADGLLALERASDTDADFRMKYFNADGSRGGMCGNGARCLVRFARDRGLNARLVRFLTDEGLYRAEVMGSGIEAPIRLFVPDPGEVHANMLPASDMSPDIDQMAAVFTGVPHAVCFQNSVADTPVESLGRSIRYDNVFPNGSNVNFAEVEKSHPARLKVRTYERGVEAETQACGTGAIASAIAAWKTGRIDGSPVQITMPGGVLTVGFNDTGDRPTQVWLEGPAVRVFRGQIEV